MSKLLSEEELKESISSYVLGTPHESHNYSIFADEVAKRLLPLIQSQKRLYAEMAIGSDWVNPTLEVQDEINKEHARQRARIIQ